MNLFRTKTFKKEYLKAKMTDTQYIKYLKYLVLLLENNLLPSEARDHSLSGEYIGFKIDTKTGDTWLLKASTEHKVKTAPLKKIKR